MYMLPFILGLIGLFYHFKRKGADALVNMLLFFFTGAAIIVYLNQPGYQPRERDYAYVGSLLCVCSVDRSCCSLFCRTSFALEHQIIEGHSGCQCVVVAFIFLFSIVVSGYDGAAALTVAVGFLALFAAVAAGLPYVLKLLKILQRSPMLHFFCMLVPVLMGAQEWDDHDRSKSNCHEIWLRTISESCAPNAISLLLAITTLIHFGTHRKWKASGLIYG